MRMYDHLPRKAHGNLYMFQNAFVLHLAKPEISEI